MSDKKFIGGGFPGLRDCDIKKISKESREKREFSVKDIISLSDLMKQNKPLKKIDEVLEIRDNIKYNDIDSILHNSYTGKTKKTNISLFNNDMLDAINGDLPKNNIKIANEYNPKRLNRQKTSKSKNSKKSRNSKKSKKNIK